MQIDAPEFEEERTPQEDHLNEFASMEDPTEKSKRNEEELLAVREEKEQLQCNLAKLMDDFNELKSKCMRMSEECQVYVRELEEDEENSNQPRLAEPGLVACKFLNSDIS